MPRVGDEFAGYRIEAVIGRGGMSVVFRAESIRLGTDVALKILAPELAQDDMFRERFVRESRIAATINHPNVVTIYDAGSAEGLLYLAMRHIRGRDLKAIIREQGALPLTRTVSITSQVASALDAAHAQKLIHRDVKPANILVYEEGDGAPSSYDHVYLTDFGLTKHSESRSGLTKTGQFVGTLDYSAPEQILGRPVTEQVDVYSLGCVVYECLTGMPPFRKDQDVATIWAHVQEQAAPVSSLRTELTPGVDAVVARAMAKLPEDRYARCGVFLADLRIEISSVMGMAPTALEDTRGRGQRVESAVLAPTGDATSAASTRPGGGISIPPMPGPPPSAPSGPSRESTAVATGEPGESASATPGGPAPSGPVLERPPASSRRRGRGALVPLALLAAFALAAGGIAVGRYVVPTGGSPAPRPTGPGEIYSHILRDHLPNPAACHESSSIEPAIKPYLLSPGDVFSTALCRPGHGLTVTYSLIHSTMWMKLPFAALAAGHRVTLSAALRPRIDDQLTNPAPGGDAGDTSCQTLSQQTNPTVGVADFWSPLGDLAHVETSELMPNTAGWVLCDPSGSGWLIEWTDKDTNILSVATGADLGQLYEYWKTTAGPRSGAME
jgi:serine/threonine protein kinase